MKTASLTYNIEYHESRPKIEVMLDTESGKEIRIAFKKGQVMKKHHTPFPIVVEVFEGSIEFGVNEETHFFTKGDMLALEASIPHDLKALDDSIVRLSLNKADTAKRVEDVAKS